MGINPDSLGGERMLFAGQPMRQANRKRFKELFKFHVFEHIGGTEPCAWAGMCEVKEGMHIIEPFFLIEILDRENVC